MATVTGSLRKNSITLDDISTTDLTVTGSLTINGTSTTLNSTNTTVTDSIIELNSGLTGANTKDIGFIFERGSTGNNAGLVWDESADRFTVFTTTDTASSDTVNTSSVADFQAGSFYGNGANLTSLNATNISTGTLANARLPDLTVSDFAGSAIQTGSESFADSDTALMTAAAVQDKILSYSYLQGNQTITLGGDVQGSGTTSITVSVNDDSHNHIISNVDGLQTALDAKLPLSGGTMTGSIAMANYNITGVNQLEFNDPGEGIVFKSGSSGDMVLKIIDDASDNILQYSGTSAVFDVVGNITTDGLTSSGSVYVGTPTTNGGVINLIQSGSNPEIRIQGGEGGASLFSIYNTATNPDAEQFFINNTLGSSHLGNKRGALKLESSSGVVLTLSGTGATFAGDIVSRRSDYPGGRLILDRTASSSGGMTSAEIHFRAYGNNTTLRTFGKIEGRNTGYTDGQIMFYTENSGTLTEALTIDSSQNATFAGTISSGAISTSANLDMNANDIIDVNQINGTGGTGWLDFNMDTDNIYPTGTTDNLTVLGSITHMNFVGDSNGNGTGGNFYWGYGVDKDDSGTFTETMALTRAGALTVQGTINSGRLTVDTTAGESAFVSTSSASGFVRFGQNVGGGNPTDNAGLHIGWNRSNGGREVNMIFNSGATNADGEMIFTAHDGTTYADIFQINGGGNVDIKSGGLRIGTTTVIDSSRNITNIVGGEIGNSTDSRGVLTLNRSSTGTTTNGVGTGADISDTNRLLTLNNPHNNGTANNYVALSFNLNPFTSTYRCMADIKLLRTTTNSSENDLVFTQRHSDATFYNNLVINSGGNVSIRGDIINAGLIDNNYTGTGVHTLQNSTSNGTVLNLTTTGDSRVLSLQSDHIYSNGAFYLGSNSYATNYRGSSHNFSTGNLYIPGAIIHEGDTDTYIQFNDTDSWRVFAGNSERLKCNTTGVIINDNSGDMDFRVESNNLDGMLFVDGGNDKVAIGTQTAADMDGRFTVQGAAIGGTAGDITVHAVIAGSRHHLDIEEERTVTGTDWQNTTYRLGMRVDTTDHQAIEFVSDANSFEHIDIRTGNRVFNTRFQHDGRVIIGSTTPLGNALFTVDASSSYSAIAVLDSAATNGGYIQLRANNSPKGTLGFGTNAGATGINDIILSSAAGNVEIQATTLSREIIFDIGGTERMKVTGNGNLKFLSQTSTFDTPGITYHTNNHLYIRGGSAGLILSDDGGQNTVQISDTGNYIRMETFDGTERVRINSAGLDIKTGSLYINQFQAVSTAGTTSKLFFGDHGDDLDVHIEGFSGGSTIYMTDGSIYFNGTSNSTAGFKMIGNTGAFHSNGDVIAYSSTLTASDRRLKENVKALENPLEKIMHLQGVKYDWKESDRGTNQIGLIAQEVEEIVPEVVNTIEDSLGELKDMKVVNYTALVPMLIEAIKEQQTIINRLEERLNNLENKGEE